MRATDAAGQRNPEKAKNTERTRTADSKETNVNPSEQTRKRTDVALREKRARGVNRLGQALLEHVSARGGPRTSRCSATARNLASAREQQT